MEAQEVFVLQIHLNLVLERENGPFRVLDSFSSFSFQIFLLLESISFLFFCVLFKYCSKTIIWGIKWIPNFMKLVLLESLWNLQAQHTICLGFLKSFIWTLIKGNIMPINAIFGKTIIWSNYTFQKIMNLIWLDSLWEV